MYMNFETKVMEALQEKGKELIPSTSLKMKVMNNISSRKQKMKKRIVTGILLASLLIPTGVFASQLLLADELYSSFDNLKKHIVSATMEGYLRLDAKLAEAKGELGAEEYKEFISLVKQITHAKLEYGDKYGNINYDALSQEREAELQQVFWKIQPYFDRLNGQQSSLELLTENEYNQYIGSLMTHEKILAKSEINPDHYVELHEIPSSLQKEFQEARDFLEYVNEKQIQND
ncbi:DUF3600 domain-containing protein [Schinkia azotoformans]|uniref:DUF3600 domain-containing protein n=2 Tax=Schinkia azotoformans TaxID=1454 RepID=UPI002E1B2AA5|nr:DUF3600 domain-containing protein [Schinkia azotoformans]